MPSWPNVGSRNSAFTASGTMKSTRAINRAKWTSYFGAGPKPRLLYANRAQGEIRDDSLGQLLPPDHAVRDLWQFVESFDLSALLTRIRSVPGHAGAPAIDPRILMALWLRATGDGVGSSRALATLCAEHLAY